MSTTPVNLLSAAGYVVLAQTGISTVPASAITGNIGLSPASSTLITGFSLVLDPTDVFATSTQVVGEVFAADYAPLTPNNLITATNDVVTAYLDASGRANPDFLNLGGGAIGGLTLGPGLYKWTTDVSATTDVTISGLATDVWIFQISGTLSIANAKKVILIGALAKNIFWQVSQGALVGSGGHFEGIILCKTTGVLQTGASMNGRILAQTAVTLQQATLTQPSS
jgi:hypothetical protein